MALIALSALPFAVAAWEHPVLAPFLAFFPLAFFQALRLDQTGDLTRVARIRSYGRVLGAVMFAFIVAHGLWQLGMISTG